MVLDTCVLVPLGTRHIFLELAARGWFQPLWSERILDELECALVRKRGVAPASVGRLRELLADQWPEAAVTGWEALERRMRNDPGDRHVLAVAARRAPSTLVTFNMQHFPEAVARAEGVTVRHPSDFLSEIDEIRPWEMQHALVTVASDFSRPRLTVFDLLEAVGRGGCHSFAERVGRRLLLPAADRPDRWWRNDGAVASTSPSSPGFCIECTPYPCPEAGCGEECDFVGTTVTRAHHTVVWTSRDDPALLSRCQLTRGGVIQPYRAEAHGPAVTG